VIREPDGVEARFVPQRVSVVSGAYCCTGPRETISAVANHPVREVNHSVYFRVCVDGVLPTLPHIHL